MNKYEYVIKLNLTIDDINKFGEEGWELVSVTTESLGYYHKNFYFKRLITN